MSRLLTATATTATTVLAAAAPALAKCPEPEISVRPTSGSPGRMLTLRATGLEPGRTTYLHRRHRESSKWVRSRKLTARPSECGNLTVRGRYLKGRRYGLWRLQLDHRKRASLGTSRKLWAEFSLARKLIAPFRPYFIALRNGS